MQTKFLELLKKWGLSVVAVLIGGTVILGILTSFNMRTEKNMEALIHGNMEELNQTAIVSLNNSIKNFTSLLNKEAELIGMQKNPTDKQLMATLVRFANEEGFKNVAIITYDGKVYSSFRGITEVAKNDKTPNLQKRETVISQPRVFVDGMLVIDISTPVYLDGINVGKLVVSVGSDYLAKMFNDNLLRGEAALNLIAADGTVITRIAKKSSPLSAKINIFTFYAANDITFTAGSPEQLASDMSSNRSVWVEYEKQGDPLCVSFMPFGMNDWYMAVSATGSVLHAQSSLIQNDAIFLTLAIMLIVILVSVVVVMQRVREQRRIDVLKNTYSIAIRKTNDLFYEADIDNDLFVDHSEQKEKTIWKETPKNYSNALIQVANICAPECRQQFLDTFLPQNIRIKMKEGISSINFDYKITPDENTERWLSATFVPVNDGSGNTKLICMENDITEQMLKQENLKRSATMDGLTGLCNKMTTKKYIDWFLANEGAEGEHALLAIDIDHFKLVNDTLGHARGDEVLTEFSAALKRIFRKSDIVGRIGGDEFIVLLKNYTVTELITAKINEVRAAFSKVHICEDDERKSVDTSASIGVALFDKDGKDFCSLSKAADIALYQAKERGRNCCAFYACAQNVPEDAGDAGDAGEREK